MFNTIQRILRTGILTEPLPQLRVPQVRPQVDPWDVTGLHQSLWRILGRALTIRHVDAGSCNGCELEIHALNNPYYNLEGAGIHFVASPRHADVLLVTGPVSVNMEEALRRTYDAVPNPKRVIALGDCAHCGGIFSSTATSANSIYSIGGIASTPNYATRGPISAIIPVDHTIPGCPPTPTAILAGILQALTTR
jgi:Ni,Fe-hydrogenase III small subunit